MSVSTLLSVNEESREGWVLKQMYYAATASPLKRASEIELGTTRVPASPAGTKAQANLKVIPTNSPSSTGQRRNLHYIEAGKLILQGYRGAIIKKNWQKTHICIKEIEITNVSMYTETNHQTTKQKINKLQMFCLYRYPWKRTQSKSNPIYHTLHVIKPCTHYMHYLRTEPFFP